MVERRRLALRQRHLGPRRPHDQLSDSSGANPAAWGQNSLSISGQPQATVTWRHTAPQVVGMEFQTTATLSPATASS